MADHIVSVADSSIRKVDRQTLLSLCEQGDLVFCWGSEKISEIIEKVSGGPSHVLMIWKPWFSSPWLTIEATFPSSTESKSGVHVGLFEDYVYSYPGSLVLCRRPALTGHEIQLEIEKGLSLLDDNYNWKTEISIVARKLLPFLPPIEEKNELYCSGLQEVMAEHTVPFKKYGVDPNTPEQDFEDTSVVVVAALVAGK